MILQPNHLYFCELKLNFIEAAFNNNAIRDKFIKAGFTDVTVTGAGRARAASGRWNGEAADVSSVVPKQVIRESIKEL